MKISSLCPVFPYKRVPYKRILLYNYIIRTITMYFTIRYLFIGFNFVMLLLFR